MMYGCNAFSEESLAGFEYSTAIGYDSLNAECGDNRQEDQ